MKTATEPSSGATVTTHRRLPERALALMSVALVLTAAVCLVVGRKATTVHTAPGAVAIANFTFTPSPLHVAVGTTVTWTNADDQPHTVTGDGAVGDSNVMQPHATYQAHFTTAGTFSYHCSLHPFMTGTVVVGG